MGLIHRENPMTDGPDTYWQDWHDHDEYARFGDELIGLLKRAHVCAAVLQEIGERHGAGPYFVKNKKAVLSISEHLEGLELIEGAGLSRLGEER